MELQKTVASVASSRKVVSKRLILRINVRQRLLNGGRVVGSNEAVTRAATRGQA